MAKSPKELTIREHLEEFRRRLVIAAGATVLTTAITLVFHRYLLEILIHPAEVALGHRPPLVFTTLTEMLGISFKVALMGGLILAIPVWAYEALMFVSPGLTPRERRAIFVFVPGITLAFIAGVVFGYFVLIPPGLGFLLTFNTDIAQPFIGIGNYINLILNLLFWLGVVFETPVVMYVLARLRVVSYRVFARGQRLAIVGAFVLGAVITPTFDPINQMLVAGPIIVLYYVGIFLAWLARPKERRNR